MDKGIALMREWADDPAAQNLIGKQISSVVAPANGSQWATAQYHTATPRPAYAFVDEVYALPWKLLSTTGGLFARAVGGVAASPVVGRNKACPCGSMQRYRDCHGSTSMRSVILRVEDAPREPG